MAARNPRRALALIALGGLLAALVGTQTPRHLSDSGTEFLSQRAQSYTAAQALQGVLGPVAFPNLAVILPPAAAHAAAVLARVQRVAVLVPRTYSSRNHRYDFVLGYVRPGLSAGAAVVRLARQLRRIPGVAVGGSALVQQELVSQTNTDVSTAAVVAIPVLFVLAVLIFSGVIATLLSVFATFVAVSFSLVALGAINAVHAVSILSLDLVVGLATGLSLDYSLLLVSRYREELVRCAAPREAISATVRSAGRTVAISSATVAVAFASALVLPIAFVRSLAIGGIVAALAAGGVALSVLPVAFLAFARRAEGLSGGRWWQARRAQRRAWGRIARGVRARPVLTTLLAVLILGSFMTPVFGIHLTGFDARSLPAGAAARGFEERVRREFDQPLLGELVVLAKGTPGAITHVVVPAMERLPNVAAGVATHIHRALWVFNIKTAAAPFSSTSQSLVRSIRALPYHLAVTGTVADYVDAAATLRADVPITAAALFVMTFVLLFAATGSVILPFVAVAVNLLSFAASLGLVVLVYQDGRFSRLLDYHSLGALLLTQPVLLGAGAFGILTDYGVFLLTRIREGRDAGHSTADAVAHGLERTGPVISSAAILLCVAVGSLLTARMLFVKELSFGILAAVILDVTVVRALLLPGLMILLGGWSWWHPRISAMRAGERRFPTGLRGAEHVHQPLPGTVDGSAVENGPRGREA